MRKLYQSAKSQGKYEFIDLLVYRFDKAAYSGGVDVYAIRRMKTLQLVEQAGGPAKFARKIGRSDSQVSQILGGKHRQIGARLARDIEKAFGLEPGYLDTPPSRFSAIVQEVAEELEKRDRETQIQILQMIRKIPPATTPQAPPWPDSEKLPLAASFPSEKAERQQATKRRKKSS